MQIFDLYGSFRESRDKLAYTFNGLVLSNLLMCPSMLCNNSCTLSHEQYDSDSQVERYPYVYNLVLVFLALLSNLRLNLRKHF
jgi:hypothetical protein